MDEPKFGPPKVEKKKVELTDEQKAEIRLEMKKFGPDQKKEARAHRKFLAEYYSDILQQKVTVQQIGAVSAYKVEEDGTLRLEPFGKPKTQHESDPTESTPKDQPPSTERPIPEVITPQIESVYDNPTKRAWRVKIKETIGAEFSPERLREARVVCLPGRALQEVIEVYLPLGVRPENIVCIERNAEVVRAMRESARLRQLPVKIFEGSVDDFLRSEHEPVTIASFDFLGPPQINFFENIKRLRAVDTFVVITNFLQRREQKDSQGLLKAFTNFKRSVDLVQDKYPAPILGSEDDRNATQYFIRVLESVKDVEPAELPEARDEGVALTMWQVLLLGNMEQVVEDLYREANKSPPFSSREERSQFLQSARRFIIQSLEIEIAKHPFLFEKLIPKIKRDALGRLIRDAAKGKRGFLRNFSSVVMTMFGGLSFTRLRRYEYASEVASSPYQTDIMVFTDWKKKLRDANRAGYNFIRESARLFGENDPASVSMRLEKNGKILPWDHAGSTAKVVVAFCVSGIPRVRVALRDLQELVSYYKRNEDKYDIATMEQLFAEPRIKIEADEQ